MKTLQDLRAIAELLPPGAAVSLPREALLEVLGDVSVQTTANGDLTVAELAAHFRRSASTVRGWIEAGRFPGAYHLPSSGAVMTFKTGRLQGRQRVRVGAWRVPASALKAFASGQQETAEASSPRIRPARAARHTTAASLGDWRNGKAAVS
jgi:hypothetical protein